MKTQILLTLTLSLFATLAQAESSQHLIQGFHFQTCDDKQCVEASSDKAWISQVDGGFSTGNPAHLAIRSKTGELLKEFEGTEAAYSPSIEVLTLDREDGSSVFISLRDGSIWIFGASEASSAPVAPDASAKGGQK